MLREDPSQLPYDSWSGLLPDDNQLSGLVFEKHTLSGRFGYVLLAAAIAAVSG
jgi:hypothetical protein